MGSVLSTVCFILKPFFGFVRGRFIEKGNCLEKNDRLMLVIGIWDFNIICNLSIGIWDFSAVL